jgi:uncharacterized membrane-anchored protein
MLLVACSLVSSLAAQSTPATPPDPAARLAEIRRLAAELKPQQGDIILADGLAKVSLPDTFRYLNPADTRTVLTKIWGNPAGDTTLGMLVPAGFDPLSDDSWVVVMSYDEDGYVKDKDASKIDYAKMLGEMKESTAEASKDREKQGYSPIELVGWASPPRYDAAAHKLYWAKELKFGQSAEHTLNYNIRMLGRKGVLVLNAVAGMNQLKQVEASTPAILGMVNFQEGHRYADFNEDTDKVATYGIAALVAGGVAAKAGFFKLLWVGILAFKKIIIIAVIAIGAFVKKLWDARKARNAFTAPPETPSGT